MCVVVYPCLLSYCLAISAPLPLADLLPMCASAPDCFYLHASYLVLVCAPVLNPWLLLIGLLNPLCEWEFMCFPYLVAFPDRWVYSLPVYVCVNGCWVIFLCLLIFVHQELFLSCRERSRGRPRHKQIRYESLLEILPIWGWSWE